MNLQLENKLALISGSTAGIGLAIARALAAEGARVIVNGRTETRVKEAIASIRAKVPSAKLEGLALDLSKADAAAQTTKHHPDLDILVNNLGVYKVKDFEQITDAEWLAIIETNFGGERSGNGQTDPGCGTADKREFIFELEIQSEIARNGSRDSLTATSLLREALHNVF